MKKTLIFVLVLCLTAALCTMFIGCAPKEDTINIVVPTGAPSLAIAKLLKDKPNYKNYKIGYAVVSGPEEVSARVINKEADLALLPTNTAASLYNSSSGISLISSNIYGILYMVGTENAASLNDLKGKVVYNIGRGGTPDLTFKHILNKNKIPYEERDTAVEGKVALTYVNSTEIVPLLKQGKAKYGILGEPMVSQALANVSGSKRLFDIQDLWKQATNSTESYPQASFIARDTLLVEKHSEFMNWFFQQLEENLIWVAAHPDEAAQALKDNGFAIPVLNAEIVAACNLKVVKAKDAKSAIETYLSAIYSFNPAAIGGKMPTDPFYYGI